MGGIIKGLIGLLTGAAPKTSGAAVTATKDTQKASQAARASLYSTGGGVLGQDLQEGQVSKRTSLLGN